MDVGGYTGKIRKSDWGNWAGSGEGSQEGEWLVGDELSVRFQNRVFKGVRGIWGEWGKILLLT